MSRMEENYRKNVVPQMMQTLKYKNVNQVPRLRKIVIDMGISAGTKDRAVLDEAVAHLSTISGQKPVVTKAKKSIAAFKIRQGMPVGCKVTLRGNRMYEFFDRLVSVAIPRIRDFRGVKDTLDGRGNYTLGLQEIIIFPEIDLDSVHYQQGMHICMVTDAKSDSEAKSLLTLMGMPFRTK